MRVLEKTPRFSLYRKEIMNTLMGLLFLLVAGFRAVWPGANAMTDDHTRNYSVSWETNVTEEGKSAEEQLKELRIEMVKSQILSKLNLTEPLPSVPPPSDSARETVRLLLGENEERQQQPQNDLVREERLVIHPKSDAMQCLQTDDSNCRLFQYELSTTLNTSSVGLWLYKTENSLSRTLTVLVSYSNSDEEKSCDQIVNETHEVGWNKLELPSILLPSSWSETFVCSIEIKGEHIEYHGDRRPFLMVSKSLSITSRQRRDVHCDSNQSCCLKPLKVSFVNIGYNFVLYPEELEANFCTGKCRMDHSTMRTHYERAMMNALEKDNSLHDLLGECWTLCCKPNQLDTVRIIYNDTKGMIHDQYVPELVVSSCSCS